MSAASSSPNFNYGFPTPGPQTPTSGDVMNHVFFSSKTEWKEAREYEQFDYIVIGTGFCCLAFVEKVVRNNPMARVLILERGPFFLPEHFQNLPLPFKNTLGGLSETFPWTLSAKTYQGKQAVRWQHGMVPFFGGRSTLWSAWCPRPTVKEMDGWPAEVIATAEEYFKQAEELLHVVPADEIDKNLPAEVAKFIGAYRPVYGALQQKIQGLLANGIKEVPSVERTIPAPLAVGAPELQGVDFQKFSTPGEILMLKDAQARLAESGKGAAIRIATECVVERVLEQEDRATALVTSRGVVNVGDAKLILAMGTLPPTTLVANSFPRAGVGERFSAHFITSIVARVPVEDYGPMNLGSLELAANYVAGTHAGDYKQQYHIQLTALYDENPAKNAPTALRYMPDVVATASLAQLQTSKGYVVFVCAVLGEMDYRNPENHFLRNGESDPTTNVTLQMLENEKDLETWDTMDKGTFEVLEKVLSPKGAGRVQYWHGAPDKGEWVSERPSEKMRRVDATVHESSTMHIGAEESAPVGLDYKLKKVENVYVTGGALWPQGGSWNPTMTMVALAQHLGDLLEPKAQAKK
ncbi:MAG: GMC oxidoreductase [Polyangiaceae bacterium]